jgi:hypothetical protein
MMGTSFCLKVRTKLDYALAETNRLLHDKAFMERSREDEKFFTRNRKMPFPKLMGFMLGTIKESSQNALIRFFAKLGESTYMTQQAFSEARQKINWSAFEELFQMSVRISYEGRYDTWHGYRVMAADGSKLLLPSDCGLQAHFGVVGKQCAIPIAQASILYDIYNKVIIDAQIAPRENGETRLVYSHIKNLLRMESFSKELIIFDRAYASAKLIGTLIDGNVHFVMRVQRKFNLAIDAITAPDSYLPFTNDNDRTVNLRVLKFQLSTGETETLITTITDRRMGINAFKELYFKRWPVETQYDELKNKLEIENFSGRTVQAIQQDFFVTMYMSNLAAIAYWEAQAIVEAQREGKNNKYQYHVNVNHEIGVLKDAFIASLLIDDERLRTTRANHILFLLSKRVTPVRPGRSRRRDLPRRKSKFHHNMKANC